MLPAHRNHKLSRTNTRTTTTSKPLRNCILCITGVDDKDKLVKLINESGGTYEPRFNSDTVTHLLAEIPVGAKARAALERQIPCLKPSWLIKCHESSALLPITDEDRWTFDELNQYESELMTSLTNSSNTMSCLSLASLDESASEEKKCDKVKFCRVFQNCVFYPCSQLLDGSNLILDLSQSSNFVEISSWVRKGSGLMSWNLDVHITHLILDEWEDLELCSKVELLQSSLPQHPAIITSKWIKTSLSNNSLAVINNTVDWNVVKSAAVLRKKQKEEEAEQAALAAIEKEKAESLSPLISFSSSFATHSEILNGQYFEIIDRGVEWDLIRSEIIIRHGGDLFSKRVYEKMKQDQQLQQHRVSAGAKQSNKSRNLLSVYLLSTTDVASCLLPTHLRLAEKEGLVKVVQVSPFWLYTSLEHCRLMNVKKSKLFSPCGRNLRFMGNNNPKGSSSIVSILPNGLQTSQPLFTSTNFKADELQGLMTLFNIIGLRYENNLKGATTHLICNDTLDNTKSHKYVRALNRRSTHIVSLDYVLELVNYGWGGRNSILTTTTETTEDGTIHQRRVEKGCEYQFSIVDWKREDDILNSRRIDNLTTDSVKAFSREKRINGSSGIGAASVRSKESDIMILSTKMYSKESSSLSSSPLQQQIKASQINNNVLKTINDDAQTKHKNGADGTKIKEEEADEATIIPATIDDDTGCELDQDLTTCRVAKEQSQNHHAVGEMVEDKLNNDKEKTNNKYGTQKSTQILRTLFDENSNDTMPNTTKNSTASFLDNSSSLLKRNSNQISRRRRRSFGTALSDQSLNLSNKRLKHIGGKYNDNEPRNNKSGDNNLGTDSAQNEVKAPIKRERDDFDSNVESQVVWFAERSQFQGETQDR